jgi:hypothetical protein
LLVVKFEFWKPSFSLIENFGMLQLEERLQYG